MLNLTPGVKYKFKPRNDAETVMIQQELAKLGYKVNPGTHQGYAGIVCITMENDMTLMQTKTDPKQSDGSTWFSKQPQVEYDLSNLKPPFQALSIEQRVEALRNSAAKRLSKGGVK